jgi:hypothetical protein
MSAEAIAEIKRLQPYRNGKKARHTTLYLLSGLDNADKHRQFVLLAAGLNNVVSTVTARGKRLELAMPDWADGTAAFVEDGAVVAHFGEKPGAWTTTPSNLLIPSPPLQESEVNVEVSGTPRVAIKIVDEEVGSKITRAARANKFP